ncbi:MAG: leucyl aminopeptidase [Proteobacteria bacterium]|nr:leucyl aminopeptidase [Pseudomonadota bacterium]
MQIEFGSDSLESAAHDAAGALFFHEGQVDVSTLEGPARGAVQRALETARFKGAQGEVLEILAPAGIKAARIVLVGVGPRGEDEGLALESFAGYAVKALLTSGVRKLELFVGDASPENAARAAFGAQLAAYRFDRYRTTGKPEKQPSIQVVKVNTRDPGRARAAHTAWASLADAIAFSRDLISEPPNILYPAEFARRVQALERLGLVVEVLGEKQLTELGMNALLSVGQGSRRESQLLVVRWDGGPEGQAPLAFVGKGVCFDSGGLTLKAGKNMDSMKWDMAGAAAVAGVMHALAGRRARVNAVGILGLVENMPDGQAQRPADVITSMSGQTIEIISTDAEGRVVLSDALWYCQNRFEPRVMVDLATLTGASQVALGVEYAALFSNTAAIAASLVEAGKAEDELLWQLPLSRRLENQLDSTVADLKNLGEPAGGAIVAALFVQRFVNGVPWAHLDITPTVWPSPSTFPTVPDGARGFGVRLLNRWVADNYED